MHKLHEPAERAPSTTTEDDDLRLAARESPPVLITAQDRHERARVARFVHDHSRWSQGPFVTNRCNGTHDPDDISWWFEQAHSGSLLIDDIAFLSHLGQTRLFSHLDEKVLRRVRTAAESADGHVRVITGAGRLLTVDIVTGRFSAELFYRLNVIHIDRSRG